MRLESRNGRNMADAFFELVDEIAPIRDDFKLDGELVILDELGRLQWVSRNSAVLRVGIFD